MSVFNPQSIVRLLQQVFGTALAVTELLKVFNQPLTSQSLKDELPQQSPYHSTDSDAQHSLSEPFSRSQFT